MAVLLALGVLTWAAPAVGTQQYETYESIVAASEPVAHYRFDDAAGSSTLIDTVGSDTASNDGIALGAAGPFGGSKSGYFGGEAYASLASNPLEGVSAFTAEVWVDWAGSSSAREPIFDFGSDASDYMYLGPVPSSTGHTIGFEIHLGSSQVELTMSKLPIREWGYVAVTETSSGTLTLYLDEDEPKTLEGVKLSPASLGGTPDVYLGKSVASGGTDFMGSLSNVAFYTKALSEEQVREHYRAAEFPVNTAPPSISGTFKEGYTLKLKEDVWIGLEPFTYFYQWQRCNEKGECPNIEGAEAKEKEYKTTYHDVGSRLRVQVEAENTTGKGGPATSAETEPIGAVVPKNTTLPTVEGEAKVGKVLKAQPGTWSGTPPKEFKYTWEVFVSKKWREVEGSEAKAREYRVRSSQVGETLRVAVIDENPAGSKTADSEATAAVAAGPPVNTKLPEISGTAEDGHTLSASTGTWAGTEPFSYAYQWELCNAKGESCEKISGATSSSYALGPGDVGDKLRVLVTATNSVASTPATSAVSAVVTAIPPSNTDLPKISGTARDGQILTASTGAWSGSPPFSYAYQWELCNAKGESCEKISGATSSSYTLGHGDVGDTLRVSVTASNPAGEASATSEASGVVAALAPSNTGLPAIFGTLRDGQTLSASTGSWEGTPSISYTYQWQGCNAKGEGCANIAGATASSYVLGHGNVGTTLRVLVTASNAVGETSATSEATGAIEALKPSNTVLPAFSGTAEEGQALSASTGSWEGTPPLTYAYQWQDCDSLGESCMNIAGATASSYILQVSDVGSTVRVLVTASNGAGSASSSSGATPVVVGDPESTIYLSEFGSEGSGDGQFRDPGDVALAPDGDLWVLDKDNDRVQEINERGVYLTQFGSSGSGDGQLDEPRGIAVDASGDVWVLDSGNYRVEKFNQDGEYLSQFALEIPGEGQLGQTEGIAVAADGDVWVSDTYHGRLVVFKSDGEYLRTVGTEGSEPGQLGEPEGLAIDTHGHVLVADFKDDDVDEFSEEGVFVAQFGSAGDGDGQLNGPYGITIGPNGDVWLAEDGNDRVQELNQSGEYVQQFGVAGSEEGYFSLGVPTGLAVNSEGDVWIADSDNDRVQEWGPGVPAAPSNVTLPGIIGEPVAGTTLNAANGSWGGTPPFSYAYQWQRCDESGETCSDISGATEANYHLRETDIGATLRVMVTAANAAGSASATSNATSTVLFGSPTNITEPVISGTAKEGETLTASEGEWEGPPPITYTYQWQSCDIFGEGCMNIAGATSASYRLQASDAGGTVRALVTAKDAGGTSSVSSQPSAVVEGTPPVNRVAPTISGTAQDGQTLTASDGEWEGTPPSSYEYQWQSCNATGGECEDIPGATASSYTLTDGDVGGSVRVVVTAINLAGSGSAISAASTRISPVAPANSSLPSIAGSAVQGQTLTANPGVWTGKPAPSYTYQWERCNTSGEACADIAAATSLTYQLGTVDVGATIRVRVVATNAASSATASSPATAVVTSTGAVAPTSTAAPVISGSPQDGQILSASSGVWEGTGPISYSYQWESCNEAGSGCEPIEGATSSSYTLSPTDEQTTLRVLVTASGPGGHAQAVSEASAMIQTGAPSELEAPFISGSPSVGEPVYAETGSWGGSEVQFSYQWERCNEAGAECQQIPGASEAEYIPQAGDAAHTLRVRVGASNADGSVTALSPTSTPVQPGGVLLNTAAPTISEEPFSRGTLDANVGGWLGSEMISYTYQWQRCDLDGGECDDIEGAVGSTYRPQEEDVGHTLRVRVSASELEGAASETSATTTPIAERGTPTVQASPSITGTGLVGYTLTATAGAWSGEGHPISYSYQWQRCGETGEPCSTIAGATEASYTLSEADAGFAIRVLVSASDTHGSTEAVSTLIIASAHSVANLASPQVSGTEELGRPLQASAGIWTGSGAIAISYEWQRCNTAGESCTKITGATAVSYSPVEADARHTLRVSATVTGASGSASATSPATPPIGTEATTPENTALPSIEGPLTVGQSLSASAGSWSGSEPISYAYEWQRCNQLGDECVEIEHATGSTYTLTTADIASTIRVITNATNAASSASATSEATETVGVAGPPANTEAPTIIGQAAEGQHLYAENGAWSGSQPLSYYYRWERCNETGESCTAIEDATKPSYTLTTADLGTTVRVNVTAVNSLSSAGSISAHTETVVSATRAGTSAALEAIEKTDPSLVARSTTAEIEEQALAPAITDAGEQLSAQSTLASSTISKTTPGELSLQTAAGELNLTPEQPAANAATMPTIVNGTAALFPETWHETDTLVRPSTLGVTTLLQLRSEHSPHTFTWQVGVGANQQLEQLPDGAIAVIEPTPEARLEEPLGEEGPTGPGPSEAPPYQEGTGVGPHAGEEELDSSLAEEGGLTPLPAAPTASTPEPSPKEGELHPQDTQAGYERDTSAMSYAEAHTTDTTLMVIEPPTVLDAAGKPVAASFVASGDTITLTISPTPEATYPITTEVPTTAPTNPVSAARDPAIYGLSDPKPPVFEHLDPGLTHAPLNIKVARDVVPYYAWETEPARGDLLTWLKAVGQHKSLKPYLTLNTGTHRSVSSQEYDADVTALIQALMNGYEVKRDKKEEEAGKKPERLPAVKLWGAWNEPDLAPDSRVTSPKQAAVLWKVANQVGAHVHCGCQIAAGEFHEYTGLMAPYIATLRTNPSYGSAMPHVWGLHDYYDLEHLQQHTAEHKGNVDLGKFLKATKGKVWVSETGVVLQNEKIATPLKTNGAHAKLQVNAANDVLRLAQGEPRVELVDYYLYEGPTKAYDQEHEKPHAFDSALVPGTGITEEQKPREAYCVLVLKEKKGCPAHGHTASVVKGSVEAISAAVTATVDPTGLPTTYTFEYGPTAEYGQTTTTAALPSEIGDQTATATLYELTPCTTYHYQVETTNEANEGTPSLGGDRTFTTQCEEQEGTPSEERGTYIEDRLLEADPVATTGPLGFPFRWWNVTRRRNITLSDGPEGTARGGDVLNTEEGRYKYRFAGPNEGYAGEGAAPAPEIEIEARHGSDWETLVGPLAPTAGDSDLTGSFDLTGATEIRVVLSQHVFEEEEPVWEFQPGFEFLIEEE